MVDPVQRRRKFVRKKHLFRSPLIEGTAAGKMPRPWPVKWGWWFLPATLFAFAGGFVWGVKHIQAQVVKAAPEILDAAGIDKTGLVFDADYRTVQVSGTLANGVTAEKITKELQERSGRQGEDIRFAIVTAQAAPEPETQVSEDQEPESPAPQSSKSEAPPTAPPAPPPEPDSPAEPDRAKGIAVAAISEGDHVLLRGTVPTQRHANVLRDTAIAEFGEAQIVNRLTVLDSPQSDEADKRINQLVAALANIDGAAANLSLNNFGLAGTINAVDEQARQKIQGEVSGTDVTTMSESRLVNPDDSQTLQDETIKLQREIDALQKDIIENVAFDTASAELKERSFATLDRVVHAMNKYRLPGVEVGGHADWRAFGPYNLDLSFRRAQTVADYLHNKGIPTERLRYLGYGESRPEASNTTVAGRAKNRRVEFIARRPFKNN